MFKVGDKVAFTAIGHSIESGEYEAWDYQVIGIIEKILMGKSGKYPGAIIRDIEYSANTYSKSWESLTKLD